MLHYCRRTTRLYLKFTCCWLAEFPTSLGCDQIKPPVPLPIFKHAHYNFNRESQAHGSLANRDNATEQVLEIGLFGGQPS